MPNQKATMYKLYYWEPIQIKDLAHRNNTCKPLRSLQMRKIMIYSWMYTSSNEILFHWLRTQVRLANTQTLNLIRPFTVCKAVNDMLGKQSRQICVLISLQCVLCAMHNWAVATAAKLLWVREGSISIYRNKESTSDLKLSVSLGKY